MAVGATPNVDLIDNWERNGTPETLAHLLEACRRDPAWVLRLLERDRELACRLTADRETLAAARQLLEERERGIRHLAVFVGEGPALPDGSATALIDRGGQRSLVPLTGSVTLDALRACPAVLLDGDGQVAGTLDGYDPPSEVGRVVEVWEAQLHVEFHAEGRLRVDVAHPVRGQFQVGDRVLVDRRHTLAVGRMPAAETLSEWVLERCPADRFTDVAAQDDAVRQIVERVFYPLQRPELMDQLRLRRSAGILLYGPTGCGKTLLGRAIAGELHERLGSESLFICLKAGNLKTKWYGETAERIRRLWRTARQEAASGKSVLLFMYEADSLGSQRAAHGSDYGIRADHDATNAWLSEMDGADTDGAHNIVCVASTNLPRSLDAAFLGRFSLQLPVRRPEEEGSASVFRAHLNHGGVPMEAPLEVLVEQVIDYIFHDRSSALLVAHLKDGKQQETIRRAHLVNGRMVRDSVEQAKWFVVRDVVEQEAPVVLRAAHLLRALDEQFTQVAGKITPANVTEFVDLPALGDGQVHRLTPAAAPGGGEWQYVS